VRVVAGIWGGRRFEAPPGRGTRPTSDRVREAIFSAVVSRIGPLDGVVALDLYAGSGALGIEALSRGVAHVTFVERDRAAAGLIRRNLEALDANPSSWSLRVADAARLRADALVAGPVALLFADPPYRIDSAEVGRVLHTIAVSGGLRRGALVAYEHSRGTTVTWPQSFTGEPERRYGDTGVSFAIYEGGP
jgi:16S rRNA (guanine966-N2)-methyltransferase